MKYKSVSTFAAILAAGLTCGSCAHREPADSAISNESRNCLTDLASGMTKRLKITQIVLEGNVVDANGNPLNGVVVKVEYSRPKTILTLSDSAENETKTVRETINSKFSFRESGYAGVAISFFKDGYTEQTLRFQRTDLFSDQEVDNDATIRRDLRVVLRKARPVNDYIEMKGVQMKVDVHRGTRKICDLSPSGFESGILALKDVPYDQVPGTKYLEIDVARDEKNGILPGITDQKLTFPAEYVLRLHSDDPSDGLFPVESFAEEAPDAEYSRKEIRLTLNEPNPRTKAACGYLKIGGRYGRLLLRSPNVITELDQETSRYFVSGYCCYVSLFINRTPGDRNLTESETGTALTTPAD